MWLTLSGLGTASSRDFLYKRKAIPTKFRKKFNGMSDRIQSQELASGGRSPANDNRRQGRYWMGTIPASSGWEPTLPLGIRYLMGQRESGGENGYDHYQIFFITTKKESLRSVRTIFAPVIGHWELTRSAAAEQYVWKELTRIGEPFHYGERPLRRNSGTDWEIVRTQAKEGSLDVLPADIYVRYYGQLSRIAADHAVPVAVERTCCVYWGETGSGKSRRAWLEAGLEAYPKDPRSKFWCGYAHQTNVIIDEFRGGIDISHLLRWLDRYPVRVEIKGSSRPLMADKFWITSNIHPRSWYPELDNATYLALERRLLITEINLS